MNQWEAGARFPCTGICWAELLSHFRMCPQTCVPLLIQRMIQVASINSSTWVCDSEVSESHLCFYYFLMSHLWWKSMCLNSHQSVDYRNQENRTVQRERITTTQTATASVIHFNDMTSVQQSIKILMSLGFEGQREETSQGLNLESELSPLCYYPKRWAVLKEVNRIRIQGSKEEQLLVRFLPGAWKCNTEAISPRE